MRHHNLQVTGSVSVNGISAATAADLATYTGSNDTKISTLQSFTASVSGTNSFTASASNRLNSIEIITASNVARLNALETHSASVDTTNITQNSRLSALETTSASVDSLNTTQNTRLTNLENKTGSLATTGSNTFIGTQVITGSLYVTTDLIVQGSSSIQNITGSSINIGTNKVILNTANPAVRYAGISVIDSGSTGLTGSILWDSTNNNWLYQNPSGAAYTSAKFIAGPQSQTLGSELGLSTNYLMKAIADDHISSSAIFDNGSIISLKSNADITGSLSTTSTITSANGFVATGYPAASGNGLFIAYNSAGTNTGSLFSYNYGTSTYNPTVIDGSSVYIYNSGASKMVVTGGNVGIGTNSPATTLHADSSSGGIVRVTRLGAGSSYTQIESDGSNGTIASSTNLSINAGGGNRIYVSGSGQIGIGTVTPKSKLQIGSNLFFDDEGSVYYGQLSFGRVIPTGVIINSSYHAYQIQNYQGKLNIQIYKGAGTSETTHQFSGSAFGINNDTPTYALDLATNSSLNYKAFRIQSVDDALITLGSTIASSQNWTFGASSNTSGQGANLFFIGTSTNAAGSVSQKLVIKSDGKVGIGTSPTYNLDVVGELGVYGSGGASAGGVSISKDTAGTGGKVQSYGANSYLVFTTNSGGTNYDRVTISSNGYVGIGTTNPGDILDVRRNQNGTTNFYFRNTDTTNATSRAYLNVVAGNSTISLMALHNDNVFIAGTSGKDMYFQQNPGGTVNMVITSTGVVRPGANGTQDFGTSSYRWGTIYTSDLSLSNGIGDYTIVEGEDDLFLYNNKRDKVYKFALIEVDPTTATPKKS